MIVSSCSTGKYKIKRTRLKRITECKSCLTLTDKDYEKPRPIEIAQLLERKENVEGAEKDTDYERPQPIRIAQLLGTAEKSRSTQKSNDHERSQPVRIAQLLGTTVKPRSIQKSNDYERSRPVRIAELLGHSEKSKNTEKDTVCKRMQSRRLGTFSTSKIIQTNKKQNTPNQPRKISKGVRRNLNFNESSTNISKEKTENCEDRNQFSTLDESVYNKCTDSLRKKSLLLPPNTIKNTYLQKSSVKKRRHSKIPRIANKSLATVKENIIQKEQKNEEVVNVLPSNKKSLHNNNFTTPVKNGKQSNEHIILESPDQLNSKHIECFETPRIARESRNLSQDRFTSNCTNLNIKGFTTSREEGECIQSLCSSLKNTKFKASEDTMQMNCTPYEISVNRAKLMSLESDLKHLLTVTEENRCTLKSMLMCITTLLSGNTLPEDNTEKRCSELNNPSRKVNNIMIDKEIQVDTYQNFVQQSEKNVQTPIGSEATAMNVSLIEDTDSDKENHDLTNRKRSDTDASFLELENQLNIEHTKSTADTISNVEKTPAMTKCKQKPSLREYLALKSTVRFLETPNGKMFKPFSQTDSTDKSALNKSYISNKILRDLHALYSDSPEGL